MIYLSCRQIKKIAKQKYFATGCQILSCISRIKRARTYFTKSGYTFKCSYFKEARASSEIENVITIQDKLYQALAAKGTQVDTATKKVLRYREAVLSGFQQIKKKGFINTNTIIQIQKVFGR